MTGFLLALLIFTVVAVIAGPVIRRLADDRAPAAVVVSALLATLVSLVVTQIVSDGLDIDGAFTWVSAAVIVWVVAAVAAFVLSKVVLRDAPGGDDE